MPRPAFTVQPADVSFITGSSANILLQVAGGRGMTYDWFKDGAPYLSTKSNKLTLRKVMASKDDGIYSVKVTNAVGMVTSNDFTVSIIDAVQVTANPASKGIISGQTGSLAVTANGGGLLTYQWQKYDAKKRTWMDVEGATSTFDVSAMSSSDEGTYRCAVSNGPSTKISKSAKLSMYVPPTFQTHPRDYKMMEFSKLTLKIKTSGTPSPAYQWQKLGTDGVTWADVSRANKSELSFSKLYKVHAGKYRVVATNAGGTTTSNEAELVVYYAPRITMNLTAQTVNESDTVTFTVAADALDAKGADITYTWFKDKKTLKDGGTISGAKTDSLTITGATGADYGSYHCEFKNGAGKINSLAAKLAIILKPYSSKPLTDLDLPQGKNATFAASVRGGKPIAYQWQKDGKDISGQTKNKLSLRSIKTADAGIYTLVATNPAGTLVLNATLTVQAAALVASSSLTDSVDVLSAREDSDSDGLANLLEHAFGSDPARRESTYAPLVDIVDDGSGKTYISFSYTVNKAAVAITCIVEHSNDLKAWVPVDLSNASVNRLDRGPFTEITVYIPVSAGSGFFRVRVSN